LNFQKLQANLFPLLKSALTVHALDAFQKQLESPSHFSKAYREPISLLKLPENSRIFIQNKFNKIEKRHQSADTLAGFENSNEIQKLYVI